MLNHFIIPINQHLLFLHGQQFPRPFTYKQDLLSPALASHVSFAHLITYIIKKPITWYVSGMPLWSHRLKDTYCFDISNDLCRSPLSLWHMTLFPDGSFVIYDPPFYTSWIWHQFEKLGTLLLVTWSLKNGQPASICCAKSICQYNSRLGRPTRHKRLFAASHFIIETRLDRNTATTLSNFWKLDFLVKWKAMLLVSWRLLLSHPATKDRIKLTQQQGIA